MPTSRLGLPTITGNMSNDIVRDLNALAEAVDSSVPKKSDFDSHASDMNKHVTPTQISNWDSKAPGNHTHTVSQITDLNSILANKANLDHSHAIANVTGLQSALNEKISSSQKNVANGVAALDDNGRLPGALMPVNGGFVLASSLTISNQTEFSIGPGLNQYNEFEIRLDDISFGANGWQNNNIFIINDNSTAEGSFNAFNSGTNTLNLGQKPSAPASNISFYRAVIRFRRLTTGFYEVSWDYQAKHNASTTLATNSARGIYSANVGIVAAIHKVTMKNEANYNMISGRAELWVKS